MSANDGGPAFPRVGFTGERGVWITGQTGMSLRDYFAGQALAALIKEALDLNHKSWSATGEHAYNIADAMLAARTAPTKEQE